MAAAPESASPHGNGPKFEAAMARLEEAERRIEILMQDEGGGARAEPFRWEEGQG